jgi:hypothetical protein
MFDSVNHTRFPKEDNVPDCASRCCVLTDSFIASHLIINRVSVIVSDCATEWTAEESRFHSRRVKNFSLLQSLQPMNPIQLI